MCMKEHLKQIPMKDMRMRFNLINSGCNRKEIIDHHDHFVPHNVHNVMCIEQKIITEPKPFLYKP